MWDEAANQDIAENLSKESKSKLEPSTTNSVSTSSSSSEAQGITTNSDSETSIKSISELPEKKLEKPSPEKSPTRDSNKGLENLYKLTHPEKSSKNSNSTQEEPKAESRNESFDNKRPFKYLSNENLKTREKLIEKRIKKLYEECGEILDTVSEIKHKLKTTPYGEEYRKHERDIKSRERETGSIEEECKKLEKEVQNVRNEMNLRKAEGGNDTNSDVQVETLYREGDLADDLITNIVLYAAIYFNGLPINDFKEVVFSLLDGAKGKIENKLLPQSKSQSEELIPELVAVNLGEYWKDNILQSDRFLEACSLEAKYNNGLMVVDFTSDNIQRSISQYFEKNKLSFRNEQLNHIEYLLFHKSQRVADKAAQLLAESAQEKSSNWLLDIVDIKGKFDDFEYGLDRISQLIYEIQFRLLPEDSAKILLPFFRRLLEKIGPEFAIDTIFLLLYRHLQSRLAFNMQNAVPQLLGWLREIIDGRGIIDSTGKSLQEHTEKSIRWLLNNEDSDSYLYDFLELVYDWLPPTELENEEDYETSHKLALEMLPQYCIDMLIPEKYYGEWNSKYILFKLLCNEQTYLIKLNMLVKWLFYKENQIKTFTDDPDSISSQFFTVSFIISEWFSILYGLKKDGKINSNAIDLANDILKQIIEVTDSNTQKRLIGCWNALIDSFLKSAEQCAQEDNILLRKQFSIRRARTKELKKIFKELQQSTKSINLGA